jgi:hypothetical protein
MEIIALYNPLSLDFLGFLVAGFDFSASGDQPTVWDSREIRAVLPNHALGQSIRQRPMEVNPFPELQPTVFKGTGE